MADVNANINIGIDTSSAAAQLAALEAQLSAFNNRIIASNAKAVAAQRQAINLLQSKIGDIGAFTTEIKSVESSVSRFSRSLEKGKLSFGEYFRYGLASTKRFGKSFDQELATIEGLAEDRVKRLSTRYISLGEDINGVHKAMAIRPTSLDNSMATNLAISAQKQQIFNELLKQGSTHLVNWGKNTQWAGRQLMVGFTLPLTAFGAIAGKIFADLEKQTISFQRVYGDLNTTTSETNQMTEQVKGLASEFTKYGISISDTMKMAADAAAAGQQGAGLITQTTQATRLATLGQMDQAQALKATIAMQNAFKMNNQQVADSVNFLNAVENQTVVSLDDITQAIPRVAPVIRGLGGDVKDLAVFMAAMQEGGVGAAEAANALKSGLASLINPSKQAKEQLKGVGIDIDSIVSTNRGDLMGIVTDFSDALKELDNTSKQRVLAQVFGKYQFARLGALFENITTEGSQAARVMDLAGMSMTDLANLSDKELGKIENAVSVKFQASIEKLKLAIAPIGEMFMKIATPIIESITNVLNVFNQLPDGVKTAVTIVVGLIAGIAPVFLMGVGLIANGIGNLMKGFGALRAMYQRMVGGVTGANNPLTQAFGYLTNAELDAIAAGQGLDGQLSDTTGQLIIQRGAVESLSSAYRSLIGTMAGVQAANPQGFAPVRRSPRRMATGGMVGGTGNGDNQPALLTPGEYVMTKEATQTYGPMLVAMNQGKLGMFNGGGPEDAVSRSRYVPQVSSEAIPQSNRAILEFGHSAGFAAGELKDTVSSLVETRDAILALGDNATDTDKALANLLDTVLNTEKTFVKFEQAADGSWVATETATKALQDLSVQAEANASLGQFGGGRITSGTRNEALKQLGVDEPISFTDLRSAAQIAETRLRELAASAGGAEAEFTPFHYAMQGLIDEYNLLENDLKAQSKYLLDNAQAMIRDGLMTDRKMDAEKALAVSLEKRNAIEKDLVRSGAMLNGEIIDSVRAQQVVEAHLLDYAGSLAISSSQHAAKRGSMSYYGSADVGKIVQPKDIAGMKIFATPATRKAVAEKLRQEGIEVGREAGVYLGPAIGEGMAQGLDVNSPPPWSIQLGAWIRQGIEEGARQSKLTTAYPAMPLQPLKVDPKIRAELERLGLAATNTAVALEKDALATNRDAVAHEHDAIATEIDAKEKTKGAGKFGNLLYALDGVSLAMSFLPGPLGEIANKIFIASASLSALKAIVDTQLIGGAIKRLLIALNILAVKTATSGAGDIAGDIPIPTGGKKGFFGKLLGKGATGAIASGAGAAAAETALAASAGEAAAATGALAAGSTAAAEGTAAAGVASGALALEMTPVGWAITAVVAALASLTAIAMPFVLTYKNTGDKIRDLGDAAELTKDQLEGLAGEFGFTAQKTGFEQPTTLAGNTIEARTQAQQAQDYIKNTPDMQEKARVIGEATDQQAAATLRAMFSNLLASGAPKDVAQSIIEAVASEAGKKKVFVPVKADLEASFDDAGAIKDMADYIERQLSPAVKDVQEQFNKFGTEGFDAAFNQDTVDNAKRIVAQLAYIPEALRKTVNPQYEWAQNVLETAKRFDLLKTSSQAAMNLLSSQFVNGQITLQQYNAGMKQVRQSIEGLGQEQALGVMQQQLIDLYPASINGAKALTNTTDAIRVLQLAASGYDMSGFMNQLAQAGTMTVDLTNKLSTLYLMMGARNKAASKLAELQQKREQWIQEHTTGGSSKGGGSGGGKNKDPFADREDAIRDELAQITIEEIKIDRKAESQFVNNFDEKFGSQTISIDDIKVNVKSFEDVEYAITMMDEKTEDLDRQMEFVQDDIDGINKLINVEQDELDKINHDIELQQQEIKKIEREYEKLLNPLEDQKQALQDNLDAINEQKDAALRIVDDQIYQLEKQQKVEQQNAEIAKDNIDEQISGIDKLIEQINVQEDALNKVADLNQYLIDQNKRQISLAQALSQGDVYAAAQAMEEMRAAQAEKAADDQKTAFKDQKKNLEDQKSGLEDQKDAIDNRLDSIQNEIDALEYQKFLIEDSYRLSIRAAEDGISAVDKQITALERERDARIEPYQKIIDDYAPKIDELNNSIWKKEQAIKKIEEERLTPLEEQAKKIKRQRDLLQDMVDDAKTEAQREKAKYDRRKEYLDQEQQILSAKREIADIDASGGGGGGGYTAGKAPKTTPFDKLITDAQAELSNLDSQIQTILDILGKGPTEQSGWQTFWDNVWPDNWDFLMPDLDWAGIWENTVNGFKNAWNGTSAWFTNNVVNPIKNTWNGIPVWFDKTIVQPIKNAWNGLVSWINNAVNTVKTAWNTLTTWFNTTVIQPIKNAWNTISENVKAVIETIAALFVAIAELFYENVVLPIKAAWDGFWESTIQPKIDWFASAWETVKTKFGEFIDSIKAKWGEFYGTTIQPAIDWISGAWETIRARFDEFIAAIKTTWDNFYAMTIQPAINWITNAWATVKTKFDEFITGIKTVWDNFYNGTIQTAINWIKDSWGNIKTKFIEFVDGIKSYWNTFWENNIQPKIDIFLNLWDNVKNAFINAFSAIGTWWDDWKTKTFDQKVESMKDALKSLFDPETWKGWMNTAVNAIKGIWNTLDPSIHVKVPDWIPVFGGNSFDVDDLIPDFATGGSVIPGDGGRDSVSAMLTPGEFVVRKSMVDKYGEPMLRSINQGAFASPKYATPTAKQYDVRSDGGNGTINAPVYNTYSVNVPVNQPGASADEIANRVIMKIKSIENGSIRRINGYQS